jgi:hypothetical protein
MKLNHLALALTVVLFALTGYLFYVGQLDRKRFASIEGRVEEGERRQSAIGGRVENVERAVGIDPSEAAAEQIERELLLAERDIIDSRIGQLEGESIASLDADSAGGSVGSGVAGGEDDSLPPLGSGSSAVDADRSVGLEPPPLNLLPQGTLPGGEGLLSASSSFSSAISGESDLTPMQRKVKNAGSIGVVEHYDSEWAFVVIGAGTEAGVEEGDRFAVRRSHYVVCSVEVSEVKEGQAIANLVPGSLDPGMEVLAGDEIIHSPLP